MTLELLRTPSRKEEEKKNFRENSEVLLDHYHFYFKPTTRIVDVVQQHSNARKKHRARAREREREGERKRVTRLGEKNVWAIRM